ncbi:MAG: hypothetical protein WAW86_00785 [Gammaproteobacteria bacterium]
MAASRDDLLQEDEVIDLASPVVHPSVFSRLFKQIRMISALYPPISVGISDGSETLMGMYRDGYRSIPLLIVASILNGGITTGISAPSTQETMEEIYTLLKQGGFPENWHALPSDIQYDLTMLVKKVLVEADIEVDENSHIDQLLEQSAGRMNYSLYELSAKILRLRDQWKGGQHNEASYADINNEALDVDHPERSRINFYASNADEIAILREDYPVVSEINAVLEKIKQWEAWPKNKRGLAFGITLPLAILSSSLDAVGTYYFIKNIPDEYSWANVLPIRFYKAFGIVCGTGAFLTACATEGKESFKGIAQLFNHRDTAQYSSHLSSIISPLLGYSLGTVNTLLEICSDYMVARDIFGITGSTKRILLGTAATISSIPNVYFMGGYGTELMDDLLGYAHQLISNREEMSKAGIAKDLVSAVIALALSSYLSQLGRLNNKAAFDAMGKDLHIHNNAFDQASTALMWTLCVYFSVTGASPLYSPIRKLVGTTVNKAAALSSCVGGLFSKKPNEADIEASQGLLSEDDDVTPVKNKYRCGGSCTIL